MAFAYLLGVDGGGSGTRVRLCDAQGSLLGQGRAGPSGLAHGVVQAWIAIGHAIDQAFAVVGRLRPANATLAVGVGIAGANHSGWAAAFAAHQPHFGALAIESDAITCLLGAHAGRPGAVVAVGTGSVGAVMSHDGRKRVVGGWGFPAGDEGSGGWMGLRALAHLQGVVDGLLPCSDYARALFDACGGRREDLLQWAMQADQTRCAALAPLVIAHAPSDASARALVKRAGGHLARMARALDPGSTLPLALCGGLAEPLRPYLPPALVERACAPLGDSAQGALQLIATGSCRPVNIAP